MRFDVSWRNRGGSADEGHDDQRNDAEGRQQGVREQDREIDHSEGTAVTERHTPRLVVIDQVAIRKDVEVTTASSMQTCMCSYDRTIEPFAGTAVDRRSGPMLARHRGGGCGSRSSRP